ncbi:3356_t:CDS:1, partial [Paraglomus brasilianum]
GCSLRPWGCVQMYCCCLARRTRKKFYQSFPVIPLQSSKPSITSLSTDSATSSSDILFQVVTLRNRLDAVELLLKDYVIDDTYLVKLDKNKESTATKVIAKSTPTPQKTSPEEVQDIQDASSKELPVTHLDNDNTSSQINQQRATDFLTTIESID